MLESLTPAHFPVDSAAPWKVLLSDEESVDLTVDAAKASGDPRPFTVTFSGPLEPQLTQATYAFEHPDVGTIPLFIVPISRDAEGMRYEAVFG